MSRKSGGAKTEAGLRGRLLAGARAMNVPLTEAGAGKLLDYLRLLDKWNRRFNLSGVSGIGEMLDRHVLDSLSVASLVSGETIVDAGSGAGLPGIPLAVLFPGKHFVLVDSNGKKTRFLLQAKLELGLDNVSVEHCRIEDYNGPGGPRGLPGAGHTCGVRRENAAYALPGRYASGDEGAPSRRGTGAAAGRLPRGVHGARTRAGRVEPPCGGDKKQRLKGRDLQWAPSWP